MGIKRSLSLLGLFCLLVTTSSALPPKSGSKFRTQNFSAMIDNRTFIDANNVLMVVTNHGYFGWNFAGLFVGPGSSAGTFYPFVDEPTISQTDIELAVLYAAGLWLGGVNQNGDTLMAITEYDDQYVPGPMIGGTFQTDRPEFKIYKLYRDSLENNPSADYLNWPVDLGAPVDSSGKPVMKGDRMLWTVFNDADPSTHDSAYAIAKTAPLGIEVQMTVWAEDSDGDYPCFLPTLRTADHVGPSRGNVKFRVTDGSQLTGDDYMVTFAEINPGEIVWYLINSTTGDTLLYAQTNQSGDIDFPEVDGIQVIVTAPTEGVTRIEEIANGSGPVVPADSVMYDLNSTGDWFVSSDGSSDFAGMDWLGHMRTDDWEIRFTPWGSRYYDLYADSLQENRAPFEVWNIGSNTPDDNSDDQRINFFTIDLDSNDVWSWGDLLYVWEQPYVEPAPIMAPYSSNDLTLGNVVLSDSSTSLSQPAEGTIIRFTTEHILTNLPSDTFTFSTQSIAPVMVGGEGNAVYIEYKLYNKGSNDISQFRVGLWADPDIGDMNDDLVGCDTINSSFFCYNSDNDDRSPYFYYYGTNPPACGFRILAGLMVPSTGDTAFFHDHWVTDHKNLGMNSFTCFTLSNRPTNLRESYQLLKGEANYQGPKYMYPGDPVTGLGDLNSDPYDQQMFASSGPVTFNSGDSQYVLLKFAVGHGENRLESVTKLKEILGVFDLPLDAPDNPNTLPDKYSLAVNYPNPFNPSTTIEYNLPRKSRVTLELFNVLGQKVRMLVDATESPGKHSAVWDGKNNDNEAVASGIYFYRLRADEYSQTRKMLLLK